MKKTVFCMVVMLFVLSACNGSSDVTQGEEADAAITVDEAKTIAEQSECVEKGDVGESEGYNDITKTWWFTLNPKPEFANSICSPACVVTEDSKTAEINWRCTGALPNQ